MDLDTFNIILFVVALLFAISFHESAHAWMAMRCGDNTARDLGRISMNPIRHIDPIGSIVFPIMMALMHGPIFGWAKPTPVSLRNVRNPRQANLLVSAAGPVSNILLAMVFTGVFILLRGVTVSDPHSSLIAFGSLIVIALKVNVFLAVFNLIPIPPLDGFGIVESLVPPAGLPVVIFLRRYGFIILFAAIWVGALNPIFRTVENLLERFLTGLS